MTDQTYCTVPGPIIDALTREQGRYFESILKVPANTIAREMLDPRKGEETAAEFLRLTGADLSGAKVLEVGAALGVNLVVWTRKHGARMTGVEPDGEGFGQSLALSRDLLAANGLDPNMARAGRGEALPFEDASFDIVYSANVLEHVDDPAAMLAECLRVVRPGGLVQIVCPNHLSWFDGHYGVFHPPLLFRGLFPFWVRWVYGRDPAFARTLRTEINPFWMRRQLRTLAPRFPNEMLDMGAATFRDRLTGRAAYTEWGTLGRVGRLVRLFRRVGLARLAAEVLIATRGWTPLILTLRRL